LYDLKLGLKLFEQLETASVFFWQQAKMDWLFLCHCHELSIWGFFHSLFSLQEVALFAGLFSIDGMYTGPKSSLVEP